MGLFIRSSSAGRIIHRLVCAFLLVTFISCGTNEFESDYRDEARDPADLILRGGVVVTVDPALGKVQAIAVNGFTIVALGSDDEISTYIGPDTEVIELQGRMVIPGFIEGHGHYMNLGQARQILDLSSVANWQELIDLVSQAVDSRAPGEWILGRGWHQEKWDSLPEDSVDGVPLNAVLSTYSPDNPVYLVHASGHAVYVNKSALQVAGIGAQTPDPDGGTIVRTASGAATGLLRENAIELLAQALEQRELRFSAAEREAINRERVLLAGSEALHYGVTSFHDAGATFDTIDFYKMLEQEGNLPLRLYVMVGGESNQSMAENLAAYLMPAQGNDFLVVRSIKRQTDGALGTHGAWLLEPYADQPNTSGLLSAPISDLERSAELALQFGYQFNTHAIGTRANREMLDLYQRTWSHNAKGGKAISGKALRWRIEHAQHIHPEDVPRFSQLGVIAAIQGIHCASDGPWIASRLGEERAQMTSYVWRDLIDSGAVVANGTDVPIEPISALASYYASVTRLTSAGIGFNINQAMTRMEALQSYTINNAYAAFEEDIKGTLAPGKLADIVVLSQNILDVAEDKIMQTQVDYTIVGGEIRFKR
ncbi:MAG: amidohydrolase [Pseudomonadales bacterium]|nr:amidohydrolase [Pseudomonadales bacterium]